MLIVGVETVFGEIAAVHVVEEIIQRRDDGGLTQLRQVYWLLEEPLGVRDDSKE